MKATIELKENETLIEQVKGDYYEPGLASRQRSGGYTFTDQRIIFTATGLFGAFVVEIAYEDIDSVGKCAIGPGLPFGIRVTTKAREKHKLSLLKRSKYIELIEQNIR